MKKKQSDLSLRVFALRVASFFYSRSRCKEQWDEDVKAGETHKEDGVESSILMEAEATRAAGEASSQKEKDRLVEQRY